MTKERYYCPKCNRKHYMDSKVGRDHLQFFGKPYILKKKQKQQQSEKWSKILNERVKNRKFVEDMLSKQGACKIAGVTYNPAQFETGYYRVVPESQIYDACIADLFVTHLSKNNPILLSSKYNKPGSYVIKKTFPSQYFPGSIQVIGGTKV